MNSGSKKNIRLREEPMFRHMQEEYLQYVQNDQR
jgi:hypothetical protein